MILPKDVSSWEGYLLALSILLVVYTWVLYPALLWIVSRLTTRTRATGRLGTRPSVSVIIPVHNEQGRIAAKLKECLSLQYPRELMEILVVSDNCTDSTEPIVQEIAAQDGRVRLLRPEQRLGKSGAQNYGVEHANGEILVLTDANTHTAPNVVEQLLENFADPKVGLATPNVYFGQPGDAVSKGQGMYWRFELVLRQLESETRILATASGQLLMMRRELYRPIPVIYGDDCVLPLDVRLQGYRVVQDGRVTVFDIMPGGIDGELRARARMTARNWTGTLSRPALLNPLRFPGTSLGLVSHKLLRWLTPFLLAAALILNTLLVFQHQRLIVLWGLQVVFYGSALIGWLCVRLERPAGWFAYPFSFCLANVGFFLGMVKAIRNQRIVAY